MTWKTGQGSYSPSAVLSLHMLLNYLFGAWVYFREIMFPHTITSSRVGVILGVILIF